MRNINKSLAMHAFRSRDEKLYYFDEHETVQCISIQEAREKDLKNLYSYDLCWNDAYSRTRTTEFIHRLFQENYFTKKNFSLLCQCMCMLKIGDTTKQLDKHLSTVKLRKECNPINLDRFITKIEHPFFIREPENQNRKTFDIIKIQANIIENWPEDKKQYIKKNIKEITTMVIKKLENNQSFKKYGIPINFLRLSHITLTHDSGILFIFELKYL